MTNTAVTVLLSSSVSQVVFDEEIFHKVRAQSNRPSSVFLRLKIYSSVLNGLLNFSLRNRIPTLLTPRLQWVAENEDDPKGGSREEWRDKGR